MNRTGLLIALAIGCVTGAVFAIWPGLDLAISGLFAESLQGHGAANDPSATGLAFPLRFDPWLEFIRRKSMWVVAAFAIPAAVTLVATLIWPRKPLMSTRASLFLLTTLALGPGLLVNLTLKDHWERPRPVDVDVFGGTDKFFPWWDTRGTCDKNCSFVGGESSGAFWTLAPAALAPPQWRPLAYAGALAFGAAVGGLRIAFGGHFFSDIVFSGVVVFLVIWVVHGLIFRWETTRMSETSIGATVERVQAALKRAVRSEPRGPA